VLRAAQVQLVEGRRHAAEAAAQRTERVVLEARRGMLSDRHGTALALTQETLTTSGSRPTSCATHGATRRCLARRLRIAPRELDRALRRRYAWFAGPYTSLDVQPLRAVRACTWRPCCAASIPPPNSRAP